MKQGIWSVIVEFIGNLTSKALNNLFELIAPKKINQFEPTRVIDLNGKFRLFYEGVGDRKQY